jgi:RNA polymerase sigma-70 factor (ECF subfamily)
MNVYLNEMERRQAKKRIATHVPLEEVVSQAPDLGFEAAPFTDPQPSPMEALLEKEKLDRLREALQELPEQMRRCVQLRVMKGVSQQEIAAIIGISVNTVKSHLHQAQRILKEKLRQHFGEIDI